MVRSRLILLVVQVKNSLSVQVLNKSLTEATVLAQMVYVPWTCNAVPAKNTQPFD